MSAIHDSLRAIGIYNAHRAVSLAREAGVAQDVYLDYRPGQNGRHYVAAAWQAVHPGHKTDPRAHFLDYGHKTFTVSQHLGREEALAAAKAWVAEQYGITEWVKIPGLPGALFPPEVAAWVKAQLKAARKAGASA